MNVETDLHFFLAKLIQPIIASEIEHQFKALKSSISFPQTTQSEEHFDLESLCQYLPDRPKIETAREWARLGIIPAHKQGKKWYFLKSEIDEYLKTGRKKTKAEKLDDLRKQAENQLELMRIKTKK